MNKSFPLYRQMDQRDCGPTCLQMIAKYYGRYHDLQELKSKMGITRQGLTMNNLLRGAEEIGFRPTGAKVTIQQLIENKPFPCILHTKNDHFIVCYDIKSKGVFGRKEYVFKIADPAKGLTVYNNFQLKNEWLIGENKDEEGTGFCLLLYPTPEFYNHGEKDENRKRDFSYFVRYLAIYKKQLFQILLSLGIGSIIQLLIPFTTQAVVDTGIKNNNISFITLVLIAQIFLFISQIGIEFLRNWILLHVNTRINISLISDFLIKLMKLPIGYFDSKRIGDIMQRIMDHDRIQNFLTGSSLQILFSFSNVLVFSFILAYYSLTILGIFLLGNMLYVLWVIAFLKKRRQIDFRRFEKQASEQSNLIQLITGMQEIKLNNCERQKRWQWENIQVGLYRISIQSLSLEQLQQLGSLFFSQFTSIFISFMAAKAVIDGDMTLGMMMSLTYIIGQLNAPITQFIGFVQAFQDAKISLERLGEIHNKKDEDTNQSTLLNRLPESKNILLKNVSFKYDGFNTDYVLKDVDLLIPQNKVTAIVGMSGSGKTTLLKLLLGFYEPSQGEILLDKTPLGRINPHVWRHYIGAVMQDGFIFSDSIANNIAIGEEDVDYERLTEAARSANILDFIYTLPQGFETQIGMEGKGISQGQKQRILIARIIYKQPEFIFFDEATNALDAENENIIMNNLFRFYENRTVVIVAHRLSTIQNADNIVVLGQGQIVETGSHEQLLEKKGVYYNLIKKQVQTKSSTI